MSIERRSLWAVPAPGRRAVQARLTVLYALLVGCFLLEPPVPMGTPTLDPSWMMALGHFLKHHAQAGVDYVFTFGPLGYFYNAVFEPDLFWGKYLWELLTKLPMPFGILAASRSYPWPLRLGLMCMPVCLQPLAPDALYLFLILVFGVVAIDHRRFSYLSVTAIAVLFAVLSMAKFTFLLYSTFCFFGWGVALALDRRWQAAVGVLTVFVIAYCVGWLCLGQSLGHLGAYFRGALEVASGYSEALWQPGRRNELGKGLVVVTSVAALFLFSLRDLIESGNLPKAGLVAAFFFLQWKEGFVRHDDPHVMIFFVSSLLCLPMLPAFFSGLDWRAPFRVGLLGVAIGAALMGVGQLERHYGSLTSFVSHLPVVVWERTGQFFSPYSLQKELDAQKRDNEKQYDLPETRARIGDESIDIFSFEQGVVLLNGLKWRPRPVFQSYVAYTPYLSEKNAQYFRSPNAPKFVLFKLQPIDGHFPMSEDGPALLELLARYVPVLRERGFVLWERRSEKGRAIPLSQGSSHRLISLNEEIKLGDAGRIKVATFHVTYSWMGKIQKFLFAPPLVSLTVRTARGVTQTFRLIPGMASSPFLISPLLTTTEAVEKFAPSKTGVDAGEPVVAFRIDVDPRNTSFFNDRVEMRLRESR